jgi:FkbM family methyltransferase
MRAGTSDAGVVRDILLFDEYHLAAFQPPKSGAVVVDVGAHIGTFLFTVAPRADRILAFEPVDENREVLTLNADACRSSRIEIEPVAVGKENGEASILLSPVNTAGHSLFNNLAPNQSPTRKIRCVRLPDVLKSHGIDHIDFLKIDCEGGEYDILDSLHEWGWHRIEQIAMEYHPVASTSEPRSGETIATSLREVGYEVSIVRLRKPGFGMLYARRQGH